MSDTRYEYNIPTTEKVDRRKLRNTFPQALDFEKIVNSGKDMPIMSKSEALEKGFTYYWTGTPCAKGHHSQRRVSTGACWACMYISSKENAGRRKEAARLLREEKAAQKAQKVMTFKDRQRFMEAYAKSGDMQVAGRVVKMSLPELQVQIARSLDFSNSVVALERRLREQGTLKQEKIKLPDHESYEWDEEKRELFIRVYVDTGDIAAARDAIGVTASMMNEELDRNEDFKAKIKEAEPKAWQALEERAIQMALRGNDKILQLVLKAKKPQEYGDKLKIEQQTTIKLSDEQINTRIEHLMNKGLIDVESSEPKSGRPSRITQTLRRIGSEEDVQ